MRNVCILLLAFVIANNSYSQDLMVKSSGRGLYLEHKVIAKESIYSISRMYHVHPKFLAAYNKIDVSKGLNLGQLLNIPLTDTNLNRNAAEGIPVYYQSSLKQTPGSISALSKTASANIRTWNKLADDNIAAGTKIIIGYMNIADGQATEAVETAKNEIAETKPVMEEKKPEVTTTADKKEEPKTGNSVKAVVVNEPAKAKEIEPVVQSITGADGDGYFKTSFTQQIISEPLSKEETVTCGIFKTTSGWNDGKYYALIDGVEAGTIIRINNPENNKIIFAKVLGSVSGIRQNQGYSLRISNAAAAALQIGETDKFIVKVNY